MADAPPDSSPAGASLPAAHVPPVARDLVVAQLSEAFANDLITLDELERRIATAYAANSPTELATLTSDLPHVAVPGMPTGQHVAFSEPPQRLSAVFGNVERSGIVDVPRRLELRVFAGNIELDLSRARFAPGVTEIVIRSLMGNVELMLPPGMLVENYAESFLSSFENQGASIEPPGGFQSTVRITGRVIMSAVEIGV